MSTLQLLQKKRDQLQARLNRNQQKKRILELKINQEFEELKKSEIFLEICSEKESAARQRTLQIEADALSVKDQDKVFEECARLSQKFQTP
jgi:hypothetical protein